MATVFLVSVTPVPSSRQRPNQRKAARSNFARLVGRVQEYEQEGSIYDDISEKVGP